MTEEIKTRQVTDEEMEVITAVGNSIAASLRAGGNQQIAMNVMMYVALRIILDLKLKPGGDRTVVFESWVKALRQSYVTTLADNGEKTNG